MAVIDVILAFPALVLLLALVAFVGQSLVGHRLIDRVPVDPRLHPGGAGHHAGRGRSGSSSWRPGRWARSAAAC